MSTLRKTSSDELHAREAVEHLLAPGAPPRAIRLLTGSPGSFTDVEQPVA